MLAIILPNDYTQIGNKLLNFSEIFKLVRVQNVLYTQIIYNFVYKEREVRICVYVREWCETSVNEPFKSVNYINPF